MVYTNKHDFSASVAHGRALLGSVLLLFLLSLALALPARAETPKEAINTLEKLQAAVALAFEETDTTALGIAVIDRGELIWLEAMGQANVEKQIPATPDTLFRIGSISKMFTALSVLKLVEEGRLDLNAPLRELVPEVAFDNPWEAEHPVRLVHMLEHTAGWGDSLIAELAYRDAATITLDKALALFPKTRKSRWVPGTRLAYSNTGTGVAGYVVEKVTGMPLEEYVQENFFDPLNMPTATFFKPEDAERHARAYTNDEALNYWHIIYRPAGSVNASPAEMVNLLHFFLERGQFEQNTLVAEASIDRMERPTTTLGAEHGVLSGYGLANYVTGFEDYAVPFYGHDGGMMGAVSAFAYAPELNSGYTFSFTGNGEVRGRVSDAIREYLLRDRVPPTIEPSPLPESFANATGLYTPINPRSDRDNFLPSYLTALRIYTEDSHLRRMPVAGGWPAPSKEYALGDNLLVSTWTGLPNMAWVQDPLAGEALQIDSGLYVKTSPLLVWGQMGFLAALALFSAVAIIYALAWAPLSVYRKTFRSAPAQAKFWPTMTSLLLLAVIIRGATVDNTQLNALGHISALSLSMFVLTLAYGVAAVWSSVTLVRLRETGIKRATFVFCALVTLLHLGFTLHLASHGMIGLRSWTI
ncbi:serine hydrolase [Marinimicrobium sp. ABcell2]|uniref:serine hydrolase domain-containing protein n=1 Tax=Marinimicrobium sp. ABcell2 TaxID=3069751 RepID=UPI0027B5C87F|nr:serine hydrolase domain-containing protein [Marinimicrobium sp. ABcell2]MDQ2075928.1 serine hydrolase domain-containing protein [Marinimicrobium sp. ABcell2]